MSGTYINLPPSSGGGGGYITAVANTNSVNLGVSGTTLSADVRLSATAATAGFFKATTTIKGGGSPGLHVELPIATTLLTGVISAADWNTFNSKQPAGSYITDLTGDVTATGPGSAAATIISVGGSTAANVNSATILANAATAANTAATIVRRDGSGNFAAGTITASLSGTASGNEPIITAGTTADYWRGDKTFQLLQISALTAVIAGTAAAVGKIGEILSATQASNTATGVGASGVYGNVISVSLTAGSWYVWGTAGFSENAAVLINGMQCGISASASGAGLSEFDTALFPGLISSTADLLLSAPGVIVDISSTTTYYLNTKFSYTSGSPQHRGQIRAWRIR